MVRVTEPNEVIKRRNGWQERRLDFSRKSPHSAVRLSFTDGELCCFRSV